MSNDLDKIFNEFLMSMVNKDNITLILELRHRWKGFLNTPAINDTPNDTVSKGDLGDFVDWIRDIDFQKYSEGWCQAGGSNGWHCTTEELLKMFNDREPVTTNTGNEENWADINWKVFPPDNATEPKENVQKEDIRYEAFIHGEGWKDVSSKFYDEMLPKYPEMVRTVKLPPKEQPKHLYITHDGVTLTFSTKEAAEQYIIDNKPCLSLNDLLKESKWLSGDKQNECRYFPVAFLKEFIKQKINN